jgi:phosphotransferase system  glucose/maltose/N-acetylglucosamine-specific IIC component
MMIITKTDIIKNGIWLTFPPLLFSVSLMTLIPNALTPAQFNEGIPDVLLNIESIGRVLVFAMPAFFSIGISTTTQKRGLALYLAGVTLYYLSYGTQNFFPNSDWSTSTLGFAASAYTNVFWTIGLGLLGEKFYFSERSRYQPIFYIVPAVVFVIAHTTHAVIYHQRSF